MTWVASGVAAVLFSGALAYGAEPVNCDQVTADVRAAVTKEPKKVLVIVEDEMVANESCAGGIVRAAIQASQADADLVKQIVTTATNVAPRMSAVIAEAAAGVAPDNSKDVAKSVKQVIGVQPEAPTTGNDFSPAPVAIQGVYLIQPAALPLGTPQVVKKVIVEHQPPRRGVPQSPSIAQQCCCKTTP